MKGWRSQRGQKSNNNKKNRRFVFFVLVMWPEMFSKGDFLSRKNQKEARRMRAEPEVIWSCSLLSRCSFS